MNNIPERELTAEEKQEQELADKIKPLIDEQIALEYNRSCGVSLDKIVI